MQQPGGKRGETLGLEPNYYLRESSIEEERWLNICLSEQLKLGSVAGVRQSLESCKRRLQLKLYSTVFSISAKPINLATATAPTERLTEYNRLHSTFSVSPVRYPKVNGPSVSWHSTIGVLWPIPGLKIETKGIPVKTLPPTQLFSHDGRPAVAEELHSLVWGRVSCLCDLRSNHPP